MALPAKKVFFGCPTTPERSRIMSAIHSRGNISTELRLQNEFRKNQIVGWRKHTPIILPANTSKGWKRTTVRPDFVFSHFKLAVFVDGDFWHGNPSRPSIPATNVSYWKLKIERNRARDHNVTRRLKIKEWKVIRIWESDLKSVPARCVLRVKNALKKQMLIGRIHSE